MESTPQEQDSKPQGQGTIINLYGLFAASLILSVLPYVTAASVSTILFLILLIAAYVVRSGAAQDSLVDNHSTFIIRTLWIAAFFSIFTSIVATVYMMGNLDYEGPLQPCAENLARRGLEWLETAPPQEVYEIVQPCMDGFMITNKSVLLNGVIIIGAPLLVYMGYRFIKGLSRAMKGYRLANPRAWF